MMVVNRVGNALVYKTTVNRLISYCGKDIAFTEINYKLLNGFNHHLITSGLKQNSISNYFRTIRAMDGIEAPNQLDNDIYFPIDELHAVISTLPFNISKRIPLSIKVIESSTFKIYVGNLINFSDSETIYIYDSLDDTYHDIKDDFFQITLAIGQYDDRFQITFTNSLLSSVTTIQNDLIIQNTVNTLSIFNSNLIDLINIKIFDISGKLINNEEAQETKELYTISTLGYSEGVYVVRVEITDGGFIVKKIVVRN
jgi:hypothetical protein